MDDVDSLTVLKYRLGGKYCFHVMDKFDEPDEVRRLEKMIEYSLELSVSSVGKDYQELWIKTCPVFEIK